MILSSTGGIDDGIFIIVAIVVIVMAGIILLPSFLRSRRMRREEAEMLSVLNEGDEIRTVSGVIGIIVEIFESDVHGKTAIISTGKDGNESTITIDVRAIAAVTFRGEKSVAELEERAAKREAERLAKKKGADDPFLDGQSSSTKKDNDE